MLQGGKSEKHIACCNTQIPERGGHQKEKNVSSYSMEDGRPSVCKEFRKLFHFFKTDLVSAICVITLIAKHQ